MTSLGETDLLRRFPHDEQARQQYLPIHPAPRHPDNKTLLRLSSRSTEELVKKSYVATERVRRAGLEDLQEYWTQSRARLYLSRASYGKLVDYVGYAPASHLVKHEMESIGIRGKPRPPSKAVLEPTGSGPGDFRRTRQPQHVTTYRETNVTTESLGRQDLMAGARTAAQLSADGVQDLARLRKLNVVAAAATQAGDATKAQSRPGHPRMPSPGSQNRGMKSGGMRVPMMQPGQGHGGSPQGYPATTAARSVDSQSTPPTPPPNGPRRAVEWQAWVSLLLCYTVLVAYAMLVFVMAYMAWLLLAPVLQAVMQYRGWACGGQLLSRTLSAEEEWLAGFLRRRLTLSTWLKTKAPVWAVAVFVYYVLLVELYR